MTDTEAVASLDINQRITLISLTATLGEQEADRFWSRYGTSLTLTAGMLAIASYTLSNKLNLVTAGIAAAGLVLTVFWYRIVVMSQFYEERWRKDMAAIINEDKVLATLLRSRSELGARNARPMNGSSTGNAKAIVICVGLFWIALGIYSLVSESNSTPSPQPQPTAFQQTTLPKSE